MDVLTDLEEHDLTYSKSRELETNGADSPADDSNMAASSADSQRTLSLVEKLAVLRFIDAGNSVHSAANHFQTNADAIQHTIQTRHLLENGRNRPSRNNLNLGDKIRVLHFIDKEHQRRQIAQRFNI